jgi:Fe-S-cluster containining protein
MQYSFRPSACSSSSVVVSSKEEKKKEKESGDSSVNVYLRLQLTCPLLATVSQLLLEAFLIADLRSELNTHLAPQALFI